MGCDEKAIMKIVTHSKYNNPFAVAQLVTDYNKRFMRDLLKDIEGETHGDFETGLMAFLRGPLANDVHTLNKALDRAGTDEESLLDVLLCRTNADIRAIAAEYRLRIGRDLLHDVKEDVNEDLGRLYSMALAGTRAEPGAPIIPTEIDHKIAEIHRATEGIRGSNAIAVAQVLTSSNDAQVRAMADAYRQKYHRSLEDVIEKEFGGDMEDALLRMLETGVDRAKSDAVGIWQPLNKTVRKDRILVNRVLTLYRDRPRLDAAKAAYKKKYGGTMARDFKTIMSGDYEDLMIGFVGKD